MTTKEELEELERFFSSITLPETLSVPGGTYNSLPTFIKENIKLLRSDDIAPIVAKVRYDDLLEIKKILSKKDTKAEE